jgi:NAD(P)-dependent dehydrogenase (short-subunit alcohol dehydrogenase family)
MTKQFGAKVALVSGRNPGFSRAIGDCIAAAYDASKDGVIGLVRVAAFKDAAAKDPAARLRSNAVRPAIIETPMAEDAVHGNQGLSAQLMAIHPTGAFGQAEEVTAVTLLPGSPGVAFVTAHAPAFNGSRLI